MTPEQRIRNLLAAAKKAARKGTEPKDPEAAARKLARVAWVRTIVERLAAAQKRADEAWERLLQPPSPLAGEGRGEGEGNHPQDGGGAVSDPPEQAELDAIHAEIRAVIDQDRWPRSLHWGDV